MRYQAKIEQEDDMWVASFPDKPNINSFGATLEEAMDKAKEALTATLGVEKDEGFEVIEPKTYEGENLYWIDTDNKNIIP
jgi:predicted RNase H-like HicB family nuclease